LALEPLFSVNVCMGSQVIIGGNDLSEGHLKLNNLLGFRNISIPAGSTAILSRKAFIVGTELLGGIGEWAHSRGNNGVDAWQMVDAY
jgi:hypothetical protein